MNVGRILRHLWIPSRLVRRFFPAGTMALICETIRESERRHRGQIRFAVESALDWRRLFHGKQPPQRALEVFSRLGVWDTAENNGVLIYLLLADRHVEIVADRGIHERVEPGGWDPICRLMETSFSAGRFEEGVVQGIQAVTEILMKEYPATGPATNELPDAPVIVR
ncbi:MAG: TPM domain-containing protein [bacterium]